MDRGSRGVVERMLEPEPSDVLNGTALGKTLH